MLRIAIDDLELGPVLGTGTVGTVYRAKLRSNGQQVAVKVLQDSISSDQLIRKRFRREMEILEKLHHPHIIEYLGGGEWDGRLFFAMELMDGGNVRDLLERYERFDWQEAASIGRQVSGALQFAHNNGIIHRDLKPGNLFLDSQASVKLGDFGIARDTHSADITSQGLTVGTNAYMSPEQITGDKAITGKADLYSLGCVLFELLTGRTPFEGANFAVLFEQHLRKEPPHVRDYAPRCPQQLDDIVRQLMEKDPDKRPFNARWVQGQLFELLTPADSTPARTSQLSPNQTDRELAGDVGAANVTDALAMDPGLRSLMRKLQPSDRSELSWVTLAILFAAIVLIILLVTWLAGE